YRDSVRDFWRAEEGTLPEFASRLTGSSDLYQGDFRRPRAGVNFVTAHDGFTLRDLVSYNDKHNEANGEDNRDGESHNRSWNSGAEGDTDDPAVLALRARQQRNLLTTLLISQGVPMISHGDEIGRTQHGNNNAYCQDNETSWTDWNLTAEQQDLLDFTKRLITLRREHPVFRRRRFLRGHDRDAAPGTAELTWLRPDGREMADDDWRRGDAHAVAVHLNGDAISEPDAFGNAVRDDSFLVLLNAHWEQVAFTLPEAAYGENWQAVVDTAAAAGAPGAAHAAGETVKVEARSTRVLMRAPGPDAGDR
ncbi:glycogen operon protein, partial [Streptomyces sp. DvalAA-14]